jgi:hypothetical protein
MLVVGYMSNMLIVRNLGRHHQGNYRDEKATPIRHRGAVPGNTL